MKCSIPEISWHNREPVLSVDIFPGGDNFYRLASGGSDTFILIWQLKINERGAVDIDILSELTRHQKAVNVVRWSPNGEFLASGDDDANIIIWQLKTDNVPLLEGDSNFKEVWNVSKILRCHKEDVYDLCWAPNSNKLLSGSVDNTAILWDLNKGKSEHILTDHKGFVQGVAWDPKNDFIATLSSDRTCRIFHSTGRQVKKRINRGLLPVKETHTLHGKEVKYFHDDTFKTFFRRLNFSPDGSLLVVPSGCVETEDSKNAMYATYIFTLDSLSQPAIILPTPAQCSIVVRCSPVLYQLRPHGPKPYIDLPYRMIIAVATDSDVILYDTQQLSPFAHFQKIHYTRLTDLTWSHDGFLLAASSTDGFITLVTFESDELGSQYIEEKSETETSFLVEEQEKVEQKPIEVAPRVIEPEPKKSSFIEQWAKQKPKRKAQEAPVVEPKQIKSDEVITIVDSPQKSKSAEPNKTPKKRITPITLKAVTPKKVNSTTLNNDKKNCIESKSVEKNNTQVKDQPKAPKRAKLITLETNCKKKTPVTKDFHIGNKVNTEEHVHMKINDETKMDVEDINREIENNKNINRKNTMNNKVNKEDTKMNKEVNKEDTKLICVNKENDKTKDQYVEIKKIYLHNKNEDVYSEKNVKTNEDKKMETKSDVSIDRTETGSSPADIPISKKKDYTRKKQSVTPNTTLLKFFKTISSEKPKSATELTDKKSEFGFKPTSLFKEDAQPIVLEDSNSCDGIEAIKIKTTALFKKKCKNVSVKTGSIDMPEEDTVPDDFCLQIEESRDANVELKENKTEPVPDKFKVAQVKQPRRIPLITLSSPKSKMKPGDT